MLKKSKTVLRKNISQGNLILRYNSEQKSKITASRGTSRTPLDLKIGSQNSNFTLKKKQKIHGFDLTFYKFEHNVHSTPHYHLEANDINNTFSLTFKTPALDNSGSPYILEKLTLCGSNKYPVRDPFTNMLQRSHSTAMNALTGPDYTSYPFSASNEVDFYNLMDVYMQSIFDPLLKKTDFQNEVWRLDFQRENDDTSPLAIKGAVYNEMKGFLLSSDGKFLSEIAKKLFEGTYYANNTGGYPQEIIKTNYEDIKDYSKSVYHPSNATIFSYGDLNPLKHQEFIEKEFFSKEKFSEKNVENQFLIHEPKIRIPAMVQLPKARTGQSLVQGRESTVGISFLCNKMGENPEDSFGLSILSFLLFDTPSSPFFKIFIEQQLCDGYCPGYGYESSIAQSYFTIGFENVESNKIKKYEKMIFEALKDIVENGFDEETVESALHMIEVQSKVDKENFGLSIFESIVGPINQKMDDLIVSQLEISDNIENIREKLRSKYFEKLIKKYFLKNERRVTLELYPDDVYSREMMMDELDSLSEKHRSLKNEEKMEIIQENILLKNDLEMLQDLEKLPKLTPENIPLTSTPINYDLEYIGDIPAYFFESSTNGINHIRIKFDLKNFPKKLTGHLSMVQQLITKTGTFGYSADEFSQLARRSLAFLNFDIKYFGNPNNTQQVEGFAELSFACLEQNQEAAFDLISLLLTEPDFQDLENLSKLIKFQSSEVANLIVQNPREYGLDIAFAGISPAQQIFSKIENVRANYYFYFLEQKTL